MYCDAEPLVVVVTWERLITSSLLRFFLYIGSIINREICLKQSSPVLIEAMTYRVGHHSTSDDSTR